MVNKFCVPVWVNPPLPVTPNPAPIQIHQEPQGSLEYLVCQGWYVLAPGADEPRPSN